jgi:hypothetical protein
VKNFSLPLIIHKDWGKLPLWGYKKEFTHLGFTCYYFEEGNKAKNQFIKILDKTLVTPGFYYKRIKPTNYWVLCEFYARCPEAILRYRLAYEKRAYNRG